jgi:RNA polymerase sigma-70 factor (ECF subfamily)
MTQDDPDLGLVQALKSGQDQALNNLMDRHRKGLFHFVLRHIPNEADALELTAEVFVRAYFCIGRFEPSAKFATWLYQIALNLCRDHSKSRAYRASLHTVSADAPAQEGREQSPLLSTERNPLEQIERREELNALEKTIHELPQNLKEPLILTALEGYSQAAAAELLGLSEKALGLKVYRARKLLLAKMNKIGFLRPCFGRGANATSGS